LGWSPGSVKGRLERGRERLRQRLARRGIALSAGLAAVLVGGPAAAVPHDLFTRTLGLTSGTPAPAIAELAAAALPAGALSKLAAVVLLSLAVGGLVVAGGDPPKADPPPAAATQPNAAPANTDRFGDPLPAGAVLRF